MDKAYKQLKLILLLSVGFSVNAQEHVHGQGQLLIAQEEQNWHLQLILPAADVLGFEHKPETQQQKNMIDKVAKHFEISDQVVQLKGRCQLHQTEYSLPDQKHEHEHEEAEAHDHHHHVATHEDEVEHSNIEVDYIFSCDSPVNGVSVSLFQWAKSLQRIKAQWILKNGQGMVELTPNAPLVEWPQ